MRVKDDMIRDFDCSRVDGPLPVAEEQAHRISPVTVPDPIRVAGALARAEIEQRSLLSGRSSPQFAIDESTNKVNISIREDVDVVVAHALMRAHALSAITVVDSEGQIVGVLNN